MKINTELYEIAHGKIEPEITAYIQKLETYFERQSQNVVGVTVLSNFCRDDDMTNFIHDIYPDMREFDIFRGLLVELRANYKISLGDIQFIHPQLHKQRAVIELPKNVDKKSVILRLRDLKEMDLNEINGKIENLAELKLSPLYNSLSVYETTYRDSEWGMNVQKLLLGYDISCDKLIINFWRYCLEKPDSHIHDMYAQLTTGKIEGATINQIFEDQCEGLMEFVTQKSDSELNYISDVTTNRILRNDHEYFVYNHCINLLGNQRPVTMQTSMLAGLKVYKNLVNNQNKFKYVFPYDSGFSGEFHSWSDMNQAQKDRLEKNFCWYKHVIPFNTFLMAKMHAKDNDRQRRLETEMQVIPQNFYNVVFCKLSSHNVYKYLGAKEIVKLQPGDNQTMIHFPLSSKHVINTSLLNNYDKVKDWQIISSEYYDEKKNMIKLPRELANLLLSYS